MKLPRDIGPIHFVGIGGIGMSGIAEVLVNLGYTVRGSDVAESANVKRLRENGIAVAIGHDAKNVVGADVVVVSSAIKRDNPELIAARTQRLPVVRRAEMLAELMRLKSCVAIAGTHGKTTTTSLVAALLDAGGFDPTVINGGIINAYGTNARLGTGDWMVVEADESDGTFLKLPTDIAIVTNIDAEHLDYFKTFDAVQKAFHDFVENVPFYGFAVMCTDHAVVQTLVGRIEDRRIITYGENPQADVRLVDLSHADGHSHFSVVFRDRAGATIHEIKNLALPMPGRHNALNATSAIAVAHELGVTDNIIRLALAGFRGVRRRFTRTGSWNGITVIDDYGHHPVEIAAVLRAARESSRGQVIAVVQPHRYTRLASLFEPFCTCFNDADAVIVAHVYPAGEAPIAGADRDSLVQGMRARGHRQVIALDGADQLAGLVRKLAQAGDYVVCLGAGNITQWAYALPDELKAIGAKGLMAFPDIVPELRAKMPKLRGRLLANQPLAELTWFRVGGPAQVLFMPEDENDLSYVLANLPGDISVTVIGLGSNLIVRDGGVPGVVIRLGRGFNDVTVEGDSRLRVGTAVPDVKVARAAQEAGISGLSFMRGIPGGIGGALRMNGGAYGRETKDALLEARGVDRCGQIHVFANGDMHYRYRHCGAPDDIIFTQALFQGAPGDRAAIAAEMDQITEAREATQPVKSRTGGSTFKNPPGHKAWQLIDAAGCRGLRVGDAQVSEMHCNFLINLGGANAGDIETLGETVRKRVKDNSGVDLEWEIKRIGVA